MKRLLVLAAVLALGALVAGRGVRADDKEADTIGKIMKKSFGKKGYKANVQQAVGKKDWDAAGKEVKAWLKHAKQLPDLKPPRGDADSYKKDAEKLVKTVTTLSEGIEKQDANKANGAIKTINGMCKSCHDNYREKAKK